MKTEDKEKALEDAIQTAEYKLNKQEDRDAPDWAAPCENLSTSFNPFMNIHARLTHYE